MRCIVIFDNHHIERSGDLWRCICKKGIHRTVKNLYASFIEMMFRSKKNIRERRHRCMI